MLFVLRFGTMNPSSSYLLLMKPKRKTYTLGLWNELADFVTERAGAQDIKGGLTRATELAYLETYVHRKDLSEELVEQFNFFIDNYEQIKYFKRNKTEIELYIKSLK